LNEDRKSSHETLKKKFKLLWEIWSSSTTYCTWKTSSSYSRSIHCISDCFEDFTNFSSKNISSTRQCFTRCLRATFDLRWKTTVDDTQSTASLAKDRKHTIHKKTRIVSIVVDITTKMTESITEFREISSRMHAQKTNMQTCADNRESFDQAKIIRTHDVAVHRRADERHAETSILHLWTFSIDDKRSRHSTYLRALKKSLH
jgi:hypothetical protein